MVTKYANSPLVFLLFLAIALPRRLAREGRAATIRHLLSRAAIFVALQRLGLASAAAGLLSLGLVAATAALLLGYFLLLRFVPVPGIGAGNFAEGMNLTNHLDRLWLPGRKYDGDHDPEGILSTLPAIATALLGLLAGKWLTGPATPWRKVGALIASGLLMLALGWAWHPFFPVIKKIWSSSFVLVAAGWSALLLALFYTLIDILHFRRGLAPFLWVGANPIALYLASGFDFFRIISERLLFPTDPSNAWLPSATTFLLILATARWLHQRQIFLKV